MKTEPTEAYEHLRSWWFEELEDDYCTTDSANEAIEIAFQEGQSSPKIKQLEWKEDCLFTDIIVSEGFSLQFYEIKIIDNTLYIGDTEQSFKTIDEAKAAAQADFEKRVKECLNI